MGEHLLCKQGVVGSNPTVSIFPCRKRQGGIRRRHGEAICAALPRGAVSCKRCLSVCGGDGRWPGGLRPEGDAATLPKPAHVALSGILEREPGGVLGVHVLSHGEDDQLLCV